MDRHLPKWQTNLGDTTVEAITSMRTRAMQPSTTQAFTHTMHAQTRGMVACLQHTACHKAQTALRVPNRINCTMHDHR
jgi:hypothetical protein